MVLGPEFPHVARSDDSPGTATRRAICSSNAGTLPRTHRNMLVFLAADQRRLEDLELAVAEQLAWQSIDEEATELDLTAQQAAQARRSEPRSRELSLAPPRYVPLAARPRRSLIRTARSSGMRSRSRARRGSRFAPETNWSTRDGSTHPSSRCCCGCASTASWSPYGRRSRRRKRAVEARSRVTSICRVSAICRYWSKRLGRVRTPRPGKPRASVSPTPRREQDRYLGLTVRGIHAAVTGTTLVVRPSKASNKPPRTVSGVGDEDDDDDAGPRQVGAR